MPKFIALIPILMSLALAACNGSSQKPAAKPEGAQGTEAAQATPEPQPQPEVPAQDKPAQSEPQPAAAAPVDDPKLQALLQPVDDMRAPDTYAVKLETTKGDIIIDVTRAWAPFGADRFFTMVQIGYLDDTAFFRVVEGFMAQVGIHGDPRVNTAWRPRSIQDDPASQSNTPGMVSFAATGRPNSRNNQFFINLVDNSRLDPMGFAPFGKVRDLTTVGALYSGYGEGYPGGKGPRQAQMQAQGNAYLKKDFPEMDYIKRASVMP